MTARPSATDRVGELGAVFQAAAGDLRLLARICDREPDGALIADLAAEPARNWFGLALAGAEADAGLELMDEALSSLEESAPDELAADYSDLFLTFGKRIAPNESYWMTEDHLERQEPMFDVRKFYAHYGIKAPNWRVRADDHLVHELEFLAHLLEIGDEAAIADAGAFMDQHLLAWAPSFFKGMAERAATRFFAGFGLASLVVLDQTRAVVEAATGRARNVTPLPDADRPSPKPEAEAPYVPGVAPTW